MFEETVSMITSFQSQPQDIILSKWLNWCKHDSPYKDVSLDYQLSPTPEKKKSMPSIIVGARCKGGHGTEHIINRTGWVAIDIDDDHNPDFTDWPGLRDELSNIKYIAFSALSLSGKGVWCLVRIKYPDKQQAHFRALKHMFKRCNVVIDTTKGLNANDKRFYSYDPDAIIKESSLTFDQLIGEPLPVPRHFPARHINLPSQNIFNRAVAYVKMKGCTFTHPYDMHDSIFRFCVYLNYHGITQAEAENWISCNLIPIAEIKSNCIKDVYKRYANAFGKGYKRL